MNYKRGKQKKHRGSEWGTPKKLQDGYDKMYTGGGKKNPKVCKKLKGPHDFKLIKDNDWFLWSYKEYRCTACGKKKIECQKIIKKN